MLSSNSCDGVDVTKRIVSLRNNSFRGDNRDTDKLRGPRDDSMTTSELCLTPCKK